MSDIFISYAREDRNRAEQLAREFERQGWSVWWDKVIPPGRKYADVIGEELASAKAVIVLWSRSSVASDWVKDEAQEGATRGVLVPVLIEKVNPPVGFRQVQTADLSEWDGSGSNAELKGLLSALADLIKKPFTHAAHYGDAGDGSDGTRRRPTALYLVVGVGLCLALAFAAYKYFIPRPTDDKSTVVSGGNTGTGGAAPCTADSRHKAAKFTSDGILMIDPGGNYDAAVLQFKEAVAECPDYADAYFWRGQSLVALNRNEEALRDFKTFLTLNPEPEQRRTAQKLVADLEGPHTPPTPTPPNTNVGGTTPNANATPHQTSNTNAANTSVTNANAAVNGNKSNPPTAGTDLPRVQVADIFASDRGARISATTRLIVEKKQDASAVRQAVASALAHPDNKSGVINTLVYLENVDPAILKQFRPEIEKLFAVAQGNGAQTVEHIKKVQARLGD
jgi:tetratricopeptide (TPR) repeat protein